VKPRKCEFAMAECLYLGHIVGNGCVRPEVSKLEAIERLPVPTTKKQVRSLLGLTGYYHKFIQNYAAITAPISDLIRKNMPNQIIWSEECDTAFRQLKALLCSSPVLRSPDFSCQFILQRQFVIQTDQCSPEWLNWVKESNSRLTRWILDLQPYQYQANCWSGTVNGNADALSRFSANFTAGGKGRSVEDCLGLNL